MTASPTSRRPSPRQPRAVTCSASGGCPFRYLADELNDHPRGRRRTRAVRDRRPARTAPRRVEAAHVPDREPEGDDGLEPPEEPRGLRAPRPLRRARGRDGGAQSCDRADARGRPRRIRPGGRVRGRRHLERGRQRPRQLAGADDDPARRLHERLLPHARHPDRHRGRHGAPAPARGRARRAVHRPGAGERPVLRVLERRRPGRRRHAMGRRAPGDQGSRPGPDVRICRHRGVLSRLPRPATAPVPGGGRAARRRCERVRPELAPVHLRPLEAPPGVRGRLARQRHDLDDGDGARGHARGARRAVAPLPGRQEPRRAPEGAQLHAAHGSPRHVARTGRRADAASRSRWTATTSASTPRPCTASPRPRCESSASHYGSHSGRARSHRRRISAGKPLHPGSRAQPCRTGRRF